MSDPHGPNALSSVPRFTPAPAQTCSLFPPISPHAPLTPATWAPSTLPRPSRRAAGGGDAALTAPARGVCAGRSPRGVGGRWTLRTRRDGDWADRIEAALNAAVAAGAAPAGAGFDLRGPAPPYGVAR